MVQPRPQLRDTEALVCKVFISADPDLYETTTRSMRLHGVVTSVRLETIFWRVLSEIGERDRMTLSQLVTKLYDEIVDARGEVENFASFLRVCCMRYQSLQALGSIPTDLSVPISSLDANAVLSRERQSTRPTCKPSADQPTRRAVAPKAASQAARG
jgi:predicted DNA-binding ribbon-helix-helix protein